VKRRVLYVAEGGAKTQQHSNKCFNLVTVTNTTVAAFLFLSRTNFTEQIPPSEADILSDGQEIRRLYGSQGFISELRRACH
jgi:hypothetical protein